MDPVFDQIHRTLFMQSPQCPISTNAALQSFYGDNNYSNIDSNNFL